MTDLAHLPVLVKALWARVAKAWAKARVMVWDKARVGAKKWKVAKEWVAEMVT